MEVFVFPQIIIDSSCNVLASTTSEFSNAELSTFVSAFNDRNATIGSGFTIAGVNYEVHRYGSLPFFGLGCIIVGLDHTTFYFHRFYETPALIYGRIPSVDPRDSEGVCLARVSLSRLINFPSSTSIVISGAAG